MGLVNNLGAYSITGKRRTAALDKKAKRDATADIMKLPPDHRIYLRNLLLAHPAEGNELVRLNMGESQ